MMSTPDGSVKDWIGSETSIGRPESAGLFASGEPQLSADCGHIRILDGMSAFQGSEVSAAWLCNVAKVAL